MQSVVGVPIFFYRLNMICNDADFEIGLWVFVCDICI